MPYNHINLLIPETKDKRVKLTKSQKHDIVLEYNQGSTSQRKLALKYNVSRRLIQFILDPEKEKRNKEQFAARQKDGRYYDKNTHKKQMKAHRKHKQQLYLNNELIEKDVYIIIESIKKRQSYIDFKNNMELIQKDDSLKASDLIVLCNDMIFIFEYADSLQIENALKITKENSMVFEMEVLKTYPTV